MSNEIVQGKVTFINHEKKYAIIEYMQGGRKKTVNGSIDEKLQKTLKEKKLIRKTHHFLVGDVVSFQIKLSDRGERMIATNIQYQYNNALDVLINKARLNNKFTGYLKVLDDKYFIKEIDSYLFFPLPFSEWQIMPPDETDETVQFSLQNLDKKEKITAALFSNEYIPEFNAAVKLFKNKTITEAEIYNITAYGIYLNVVGDKIRAKIPADKIQGSIPVKIGDKLPVLITYLSKERIIVEIAQP